MSLLDNIRNEAENSSTAVAQLEKPDENGFVAYKPQELDTQQIAEVKAKPITLTPQQRSIVDKAKNSIDFMNPLSVQSMDDGVNQKLNSFNSQMLQRAKVSEVADMSPLIVDVVKKSKMMDPSVLNKASSKGGFLGVFGKAKDKISTYKMQFETVEKQFDVIVGQLENDVITQKQALEHMDTMFKTNFEQYCDLKLLIVAGEEKLADIHQNVLPKLRLEAEQNPDTYAVQTYQQAVNATHRLEKKVSDMNLLRVDCIQTAQIIHIIESNAIAQIDSTNQTINGAIQQWKRGVTIALTLRDQKAAAERDKMVRDANNAMRVRVGEMLEQTTVLVAENNERGAVDFETLEKVNNSLMRTMERVSQIQSDGRKRRSEERGKLEGLENQLRQAVIANGRNQQQNMLANQTLSIGNTQDIPSNRLDYK